MKKVFQIRLSKITYEDFINFFDFTRFDPDRFNVKYMSKDRHNYYENLEKVRYGVFDLNHVKLGFLRFKQYSKFSIIYFYIEENKYRQAFLEYIRNTIKEMKFVGFKIQETQAFNGDTINVENEGKPYFPKTEAARKIWREIYGEIKTYRLEIEDSDALDLFVPKPEDYRDRIKNKLQLKRTNKTISRIIRAGDAGLLDE